MASFKIFESKEFGKITLINIENEIFFIGREIAFITGYADLTGAMRRNVKDCDKRTFNLSQFDMWNELKEEWQLRSGKGNLSSRVLITKKGVDDLVEASNFNKKETLKYWIKEILKTTEIEVYDNCNTSVILNKAETEIFSCSEFGDLTVLEIGNEPWFLGKEVAEKLGYEATRNAITNHVDEEDIKTLKFKGCTEIVQATLWKGSDYADKKLINESGLYSLVLGSKLESAKRFKRWVTKDILPSIRKHGAYMTPNTLQEAINNPDFTIGLLEALKKEQNEKLEEQNKRIEAEQQRDRLIHHGKLYTATEIAKELGFKSAQEFNSELERRKIQYKVNGTWVLTARYAEKGYVSIKQLELDNGQITYDRKWTGKGRDFLLSEFAQLKINVLEESK